MTIRLKQGIVVSPTASEARLNQWTESAAGIYTYS